MRIALALGFGFGRAALQVESATLQQVISKGRSGEGAQGVATGASEVSSCLLNVAGEFEQFLAASNCIRLSFCATELVPGLILTQLLFGADLPIDKLLELAPIRDLLTRLFLARTYLYFQWI